MTIARKGPFEGRSAAMDTAIYSLTELCNNDLSTVLKFVCITENGTVLNEAQTTAETIGQ